MKYVIRHVPYGWKTTAIVVQKANSHYLSEPVIRLGYITRYYGYKYIQIDFNLLGYCLCHGVRYESNASTNKAMTMMINKWHYDTNVLLKRTDSKAYFGKEKVHREYRLRRNPEGEADDAAVAAKEAEERRARYHRQPWISSP